MNMNKLVLVISFIALSMQVFAQKGKVNTASIQLMNGQMMEAKESIDKAFSDPAVGEMAKAWLVKAQVYQGIYDSKVFLADFPDALQIAKEAYLKAYDLDVADKGKKVDDISTGLTNLSGYLFNEGLTFYKDGDFEKSYVYFNDVQSINNFMIDKEMTDRIDTTAILVTAYSASNTQRYDEAQGLYEKLINLKLDNPSIYNYLAEIYKSKGEEQKSLDVLAKGRELYPSDISLIISELNHYLAKGEADKVIDKLKNAIDLDPENHTLYFSYGSALESVGRAEEAMEAYETAIEIKPDYYEAYFNMGAVHYNKAIELNKQINDMAWNDPKLKDVEAERNSLYEKALPFFEKSVEINHEDPGTLTALKEIYARMNMMDKLEEIKKYEK